MGFNVKVSRVVDNQSKKLPFLQPLFEALTNSIEANATNIIVDFVAEEALEGITSKIVGFTITDNGIGFNKKNIEAFCELYTSNKIDMGCKGFGRVTWLAVFDEADIKSFTGEKEVNIHFHRDFDPERDINERSSNLSRKTIIKFSGVTDNFYKPGQGERGRPIDKRSSADLLLLKDAVEKHLLVKLSLLKQRGVRFNIRFNLHDHSVDLNNDNIIELEHKEFRIEGVDGECYDFTLYYSFISNGANQKDLFYCANYRAVTHFATDISLENLPNNDSVIMLLCSDYLDERVNIERNQFTILPSDKNATPLDPVSFPVINTELKKVVQNIVLDTYPEVEDKNEAQVLEAINEYPYLAKYIKKDDSIVKSKIALIDSAKNQYEKEKNTIKTRFNHLLNRDEVDEEKFFETMAEISDISARELGAYIGYRQQIIAGLKKMSADNEQIESLIHNLFMKMKTVVNPDINPDVNILNAYDSNLWLLDDKFLSYSYAASDTKINRILQDNGLDKDPDKGGLAPDLAVFYSGKEDSENLSCVLIEIKPFGISAAKKFAGLRQVKEYARVFYANNNKITNFWVYMVTKIDEDFARELHTDGYTPLYSTADGHKIFVRYFNNEVPPIYLDVVCVDAIIEDAEARNKVFLDILKRS